jgi:hypothetical protein
MRSRATLRCATALALILSATPIALRAQTTEDSIKTAVNALFDAMRKSDSASIVVCFAEGSILQSVGEQGKVQTIPLTGFAHIISAIPAGAADERPQFDVIRVDGSLAIVWAPYKFIYKGALHHCGEDSFQMVRQGGTWKIQYIIDTERKQGCE